MFEVKILEEGIMPDGTPIRIEEWSESYSFMPYGSTIARFAPKGGEIYRFEFNFNTPEETKQAFDNLLSGIKTLADYSANLSKKEYSDCI
jgi:hypothetical protein